LTSLRKVSDLPRLVIGNSLLEGVGGASEKMMFALKICGPRSDLLRISTLSIATCFALICVREAVGCIEQG
jgi:hypothetical protein